MKYIVAATRITKEKAMLSVWIAAQYRKNTENALKRCENVKRM
jgi:hypothetical protein